jgi:hypothetical protein
MAATAYDVLKMARKFMGFVRAAEAQVSEVLSPAVTHSHSNLRFISVVV